MNIPGKKTDLIHALFFIAIVAVISLYYNYQSVFYRQPQSIHAWRQSDGAMIALNYYQNGMNFFSPETNNLTSDNGTSGKCCTSEIPFIYYGVAILYKLFGHHDAIFRMVSFLIFFLGLFYLYRLFNYLLKDFVWSVVLSLFFFTSPVLAYYANGFLTNTSALAFSIVGWFYFIRYDKEKDQKWFFLSLIAFFLAGSCKVTSLISVCAIIVVLILDWIIQIKLDKGNSIFNKQFKLLLCFLPLFLIIAGWILYAKSFNKLHDTTYFSTTLFPIWDLGKETIIQVVRNVSTYWFSSYFHPSVHAFVFIGFIYTLIYWKKNKNLNIAISILVVGTIVFIITQFYTLRDHDYYVIDLFILPVLILISSFDILKQKHPILFNSIIFKSFVVLLFLFNIHHAHQKLDDRYGKMNNYFEMQDVYTLEPTLRDLGIKPSDKVISVPDVSHLSLYLMNQRGWTEYTDMKYNKGKRIPFNQDSAGVALSITRGAKYLIINGIEQFYFKPYLQPFCTHLLGKHNNVLIFALNDNVKNFSLHDRKRVGTYFCDAENRNADGSCFLGSTGDVVFHGGETQNHEQAFNGNYSSRLNAQSPYGMTVKLANIQKGESFEVTVWRKVADNTNKGAIVVSSDNPDEFYRSDFDIKEKGADGWQKLSSAFFLTKDLKGNELTFYLFNPDPIPAYFDDFEIIRYSNDF